MATERILDLEGAFMESAEAKRAEVDIPLPVIDLDEADVFAPANAADELPGVPASQWRDAPCARCGTLVCVGARIHVLS